MSRLWECVRSQASQPVQRQLAEAAEAAAESFVRELGYRFDGRELDIARAAYILGWLNGQRQQTDRKGNRTPW